MLPLWVRANLRAIAMKGYSAFPKLKYYWRLAIRLFSVIFRTLIGESYPSTAMQLVYSAAQVDWANILFMYIC